MTPRKAKLNTKLSIALHVNKETKIELIIIRRQLFRRYKRIANMKYIIGDLQKNRFIILTKIGPNELYLIKIQDIELCQERIQMY